MAAPGPRTRTIRTWGPIPSRPICGTSIRAPADNGGVHINSGIPNHAFYLAAMAIGGRAWEKAGVIWYDTLRKLTANSKFSDCAKTTYQVAGTRFGQGSKEQKAVQKGWDAVGIQV